MKASSGAGGAFGRQNVLVGPGLHSGARCRVSLEAADGPVRLRQNGVEVPVDELVVASTSRATTVEARGGALRVQTTEHLFAALAGLGVRAGVVVTVEGPELPLLDGGALVWCDAITSTLEARSPEPGASAGLPRLRVAREAVLEVGSSVYAFVPGGAVGVSVYVAFDGFDASRIAPDARWDGDPADFRARIAPARTFALVRDLAELESMGLARHADPASVVVVAPDAVHHAGRAPSSDEPARHKLLDLLGDLYLGGGPPVGRVHAVRPGHAANAEALRLALRGGILVAEPDR